MFHVLRHCHNKDPMLWPAAVTANFDSAVKGIPHLSALPIFQDVNGKEVEAAMLAAEVPAESHSSSNVFAQLGLEIG